MFGASNNTFGGFGQQQQQQQPQGGLFGGGGGFGAKPAFGAPATPGFGQPAAQSTGFGGFGAPAGNTAFGSPAPAAPSFGGGGLFGAAAPASSGFSFGGATNTGFGAPTTSAVPSGGLFGAKPATTFGGAFGAAPAAGGLFGAAGSTFGAAAPAVGQGTANPPFQPHLDKDGGVQSLLQSISAMPAYAKYSFEELRLQDYQANRKNPQAATGFGGAGFGAPTPAFGAPAPANNIFGAAAGGFGAPATPAATGFGAPQASIFGSGGGFGQPAPAANMFGAAPAAPAGGMFGGGFGAAPAAPAFGAPAAGGLFGQAPKPASLFNFGGAAAAPAPAAGGLFGQPQQGAFGAPAPAAGGLFGQPAQPAAGGFSFGAPKPAGGLFGAAPAAGAFGAPAEAPKPSFSFNQPAAPGGLFGAPAAQPLGFGAPPAQPQQSLFGGASPGFGAPAANSFGAGGLFGAKPAAPAGGLFGAPAQPQGGLFGAPQQQAQPSPFGGLGGSFGGGNSLLGQSQPQQQQQQQLLYASVDDNAYGSNPLFANVGAQAAPVNASIDNKKKPPLSSTFRATPRSNTKITRLRGFGSSSTVGSSLAIGGSPMGINSPISFGSSIGAGALGTPTSGRGSPLQLINGLGEEAILGPGAFVQRNSVKKLVIERRGINDDLIKSRLGSNENGAPPKSKDFGGKAKVSFNPEFEVAARDRANASAGSDLFGSMTPIKKVGNDIGQQEVLEEEESFIDNSSSILKDSIRGPASTSAATTRALAEGEYYTSPTLETLRKLPASALQSLPDLTVGRVGFGSVTFNAPVDLTTLNSVEDLCGSIIVFEERTCTVYPSDYEDKPPLGQGLNQPGTITLLRCFPLDKSTRQPIKEKNHPKLISHIKRLRNLDGTEFIDFRVEEGSWTFAVEGF